MSDPLRASVPLTGILLLALLPAACGGGGGGGETPAQLPRLELRDATFAAGAATVALPVVLSSIDETRPSLLQFELTTDAAALEFTGEVVPAAGVAAVAAQIVAPGRLRVVVGDSTSTTSPAALPDGALLTAVLRRGPSAVAGTPVEVRLENDRATDVQDAEAGFDSDPVTARITP